MLSSFDHNVYALNATNGAKLWNYAMGNFAEDWSSPAVINGVVYIGSEDENIYALNVTNGDKLWSENLVGTIDSSPRSPMAWFTLALLMITFML